jgi:predicted permease
MTPDPVDGPPEGSRRLLVRLLPPADRDSFPAELEELYRRRLGEQGATRARRWYRRQVLHLVGRRVVDTIVDATRRGIDMDWMRRDLTYAVRRLARAPGFTLVALVSLTLGIGANTAIFSLVNALVLRPQPLERPDEVVDLYMSQPGFSHGTLSHPDLIDLREQLGDVFQGLTAARFALLNGQADDGSTEMHPAEMVLGDYFTLQGIEASLGRTLLPEDDVEGGAAPVVVLDHRFWERRFGGDPSLVGREIRIGGVPLTVVGVVQPDYQGTLRGLVPDLYLPVQLQSRIDPTNPDLEGRGNQSFFARARLRDGVSPEQAEAAVERAAGWLRATYPDDWQVDEALVLVPREDVVVNPMIDRVLVPALGLLLGIVGVVLVIACANLASFLLARAADRKREVAVRLALGASRSALVRQLLVETLILALLGGVGGVALAAWLTGLLPMLDLPLPIPVTLDLSLDRTVLVFALGASLLAGGVFGLAPALQATRPALAATLKDEATGGAPRRLGLRNVLVVGQVALSLVLLVGAGLLLRSMQARQSLDPGFGGGSAALVQLSASVDGEVGFQRLQEIARRVQELPGVQSVGMATNIHLNTLSTSSRYVEVDGVAPPAGRDQWQIDWAAVSPDWFDATGHDLLSGREFDEGDLDADAAPVLIVNEAFAERFFAGEDPIGRTARMGDTERTVVGMVRTAKIRSLGEDPRPFMYTPFNVETGGFGFMVARTEGVDARGTALEMARTGRRVDPDLRTFGEGTLERHLAIVLFPARASAWAATVFASLALALAAIGLYGVVSYAVARKSREVGIRMSLGARGDQVVRMLMFDGLRLVAVGGVVGVALSVAFAQVLSGFLYGVSALDPAAFAGTAATLAVVAVLAAWIPARRVTRIDPVRALRSE